MTQLAIIKSPRFGVDQFGRIGLTFAAYIEEGVGSPQFLPLLAAAGMVGAYDVADVSRLDGKPCWVSVQGNYCEFLRPCTI